MSTVRIKTILGPWRTACFRCRKTLVSPSSWSHGCILDVQILCAQDILPLNSQYITAWHVHFLDELRCQKLEQLILITTVSEKLIHFSLGDWSLRCDAGSSALCSSAFLMSLCLNTSYLFIAFPYDIQPCRCAIYVCLEK